MLSYVSESRLHQRKAASNVKFVIVHASPVYASSVSELVRPLNISKPNTSSVSQLLKPSIKRKPVLSNNVRNVCNVSSISQLVKTFSVTKSVCSSNARNSVVCNPTCKPVSNFVCDCQSVKPARKFIDVNRKHQHERLVNNKNSRQHDFTEPFSAVNTLMTSVYF